jgi:hypothetical protein
LLDKQCKLCRPHVGLYEPANAGPHPAQGPPAHSKRPRSGLSEYTTFLQPATGISHTTSVCHQPGVREEFTGAGNGLAATDLALLLDIINDSARSLVPHCTCRFLRLLPPLEVPVPGDLDPHCLFSSASENIVKRGAAFARPLSPLVEEGSSPWRLPRSIGGRS